MRFFNIKMITLAFLLVFGTIGVLYSVEEECHYCNHAHGTGTAGFPTCDAAHWTDEKQEGKAKGNCQSGGSDTCEDDRVKLDVDIATYKCVRYPYRWEQQYTEEIEMDDCLQWTPC